MHAAMRCEKAIVTIGSMRFSENKRKGHQEEFVAVVVRGMKSPCTPIIRTRAIDVVPNNLHGMLMRFT